MDDFEIHHRGVTYHIEPTETGYFAEVLELPGCVTEGVSLDDVFANIQEALRLYVEGSLAEGLPIPDRYRTLLVAGR